MARSSIPLVHRQAQQGRKHCPRGGLRREHPRRRFRRRRRRRTRGRCFHGARGARLHPSNARRRGRAQRARDRGGPERKLRCAACKRSGTHFRPQQSAKNRVREKNTTHGRKEEIKNISFDDGCMRRNRSPPQLHHYHHRSDARTVASPSSATDTMFVKRPATVPSSAAARRAAFAVRAALPSATQPSAAACAPPAWEDAAFRRLLLDDLPAFRRRRASCRCARDGGPMRSLRHFCRSR